MLNGLWRNADKPEKDANKACTVLLRRKNLFGTQAFFSAFPQRLAYLNSPFPFPDFLGVACLPRRLAPSARCHGCTHGGCTHGQ
ncbi:MAG TPA: hypothetical protein DHV59_12480 [Oxalobacteraceae bacterium]|nr:hypothetical protein [Oxalobacteraceae bacterium]